MNIFAVVGGSLDGAFVLSTTLLTFKIRTQAHEAELTFKHCTPFAWFIEHYGNELENPTSIWHNGVKALQFCGGYWYLRIDTNFVPITIGDE